MKKILKAKQNIILFSTMVLFDVFIKTLIDNFFMENKFYLNSKLGFVPFLNTEQLSIFNNELGLDVSLKFLIVINLICAVAIIFARNVLKKEKEWNRVIDVGTLMVFAGVVCSLIDKIFWGGSLDYILFFEQILDLKDIYLFAGLGICIVELVRQSIEKSDIGAEKA